MSERKDKPIRLNIPDPALGTQIQGAQDQPDEKLVIPFDGQWMPTIHPTLMGRNYTTMSNMRYVEKGSSLPESVLGMETLSSTEEVYPIPTPPPPTPVTKLYALASGVDGIHGYIINIEDMSIITDVTYDPAVVSAWPGNTSGDMAWVPALNKFVVSGTGKVSHNIPYIYEIDSSMTIVGKIAEGTVTTGTDSNIYTDVGTPSGWYDAGMAADYNQPITGAWWTMAYVLIDSDVTRKVIDTWVLGGSSYSAAQDPIDSNVIYYAGYYYVIAGTVSKVLVSTGRAENNSDKSWGYVRATEMGGGRIIAVSHAPWGGTVAEIDLPSLTVIQETAAVGGYMQKPFIKDGYAYFTYIVYADSTSHLCKLKLSDFSIASIALNDPSVGDGLSCWLAGDGNLYVSTIQGFYIINPDTLAITGTYVGYGARGLAEGKTLDGRSWLFGAEPTTGKIQKYGPLPTFVFAGETLALVASPTQKITCVEGI